jgi:apolipoprotein N-acyltransferase
LEGESEILKRVNSIFHSNCISNTSRRRATIFGVRAVLFLGLLLVACWRPADPLIPAAFILLASAFLDRRGLTIAAAAGLVTVLYHWAPAAILLGVFSYTLFFYSLIGLRSRRAAIVGFGFGAGVVALNLRWLVAEFDAHWAGLILFLISLYGGLFMAAVAALLRYSLVRRSGIVGMMLTMLALPALDYVRVAIPRFGTSNLYSAHLTVANLAIAQVAHWVGAGGLSALLALCSYATANWLAHERRTQWSPRVAARRAARRSFGFALAVFLFMIGVGELDRYLSASNQNSTHLKIALIQSALPSDVGTTQPLDSPANNSQPERALETESTKEGADSENYAAALRSYLHSHDRCDIVFLPEGAISIGDWNDPDDPNAEPLMSLSALREKFGAEIDSFLVTGAMIREQLDKKLGFRNTAISLDPHLNLIGQVDKQFGAPLVEVNPFQGIPVLEAIGERATHLSRQMKPERNSAVLPIDQRLRAVVAICSEHQLPDIWAWRGLQDFSSVNLQLVLSDVSWFDGSEEERDQSRLARRLLVVKYRLPLLYVTNGASELWNRDGTLARVLGAHAQFGIWDLSVPRLDAAYRSWQPPSELWPLALFVALFAWRLYRSKRVTRPSSQ